MDVESYEFMRVNTPQIPPAIVAGNIIVKDSGNILWGQPKTMKSVLGVQLVSCIASGSEFLRQQCAPTNCLYVQTEIPKPYFHQRIIQMGQNINVPPNSLFFASAFNIKLDTKEGQKQILSAVKKHNIGLFVIDPLYKALMRQDEVNIQAGLEFLDLLKSLGVTVVIIHHSRKADRMGGDMGGNEIRGPLLEQWADSLIRISGNVTEDLRILDFELRHATTTVPQMAITLDRTKLWFQRTV